MKVLLLEVGVGYNTPAIVKYSFWRMTYQNPKAMYVWPNENHNLVWPDIPYPRANPPLKIHKYVLYLSNIDNIHYME